MTKLRFRHLRMRAMTSAGLYGTDIRFCNGLNVIWADNTKGKSTCMQGMLFALGMERMLSPRREVPLPHAMTSYLEDDKKIKREISESNISLEIENSAGRVITVHRSVKSKIDNRLIKVDFGPTLTDSTARPQQREFFVIDGGAATREDGFHHFLEDFLGWRLPIVLRYDSPDAKLYLETIFPLFWVEQKAGWSSIPAAIPTYLRIREVHKRAIEFIMDLDVHKLESRRQHLDDLLEENALDWRLQWDEISMIVQRAGGQLEALVDKPTIIFDRLSQGHINIRYQDEWRPIEEVLTHLRVRLAEIVTVPVPDVDSAASEVAAQLQDVNNKVEIINAKRIQLYNSKQLKNSYIGSLMRRIRTLREDLQKNQDVQKLQRYSGTVSDLTPTYCPTCEQSLADALVSQNTLSAIMPIEDNIEYVRSQGKMFEDILNREEEELRSLDKDISMMDRELFESYSHSRSLRSDLIAPGTNPSASVIAEQVRTENRIRELEGIQLSFAEAIERFLGLSVTYKELSNELSALPPDKMSPEDKRKFDKLTKLVREQAQVFGFSTFDPGEINISEDTYRPQKEGFEIGFETSASDAIRLKWAYQLGLLELDAFEKTNHPGLLVFDEPRQQSSARVSFENLLKRATATKSRNQQVIFSTSEELRNLRRITAELDCEEHIFPGYILQPIAAG